jgi:N-acetylneuraminic acid mutarotase
MAGASLGSFGYAIGGQSAASGGAGMNDVDEYDPTADVWAARANLPNPPRSFLGAAGDGSKIYAFAGFNFVGGVNGYLDVPDVDEYDPGGDSWSLKADMPTPSRRAPAYAEVGGKIYSWGGTDGDGTQFGVVRLRDNDEYDPAGDSWAARTDLPIPARDKIMGGASVGGKGYVVGGASSELSGQHTGMDDCDEYNPATDSWTSKADSGLNRAMLAVTQSSDGLVHAFGGSHLTTFWSQSHQCYDPSTDSWLSKVVLPSPERTLAAAFSA